MNTKVLIMDYSTFEREKIKYILNNLGGFTTLEINNLENYHKNIDSYKNLAFIIMDISFPFETDGFNVLNDLRRNPEIKNTPIIIVTKSNNSDYKKTALQYAVNDYIIKPYNVNRLESSINSILKIDRVDAYKISNTNRIIMTYEDYITKELKTCSRVKQPLSIIFTTSLNSTILSKDINKEIENKYFTIAAEKMKSVLRATDTVILNDNYDILAILPFTDAENAKIVNKKSRTKIAEQLFKNIKEYDEFFYSVIVSFPEDGMDFHKLMEVVSKKLADKKLLEKIVSIPINLNNSQYSKTKQFDFKNFS